MTHLGADGIELLQTIVDAFEEPHSATHQREPIFYFRSAGGSRLQHHALGDDAAFTFAESDLEELSYGGLLDIDYGQGTWKLVPTPLGRQTVHDVAAAKDTELRAEADAFLEAATAVAESGNPLAWATSLELLAGLRQHWQAAGFPVEGIRLSPLMHALPEEQEPAAAAALRALRSNGYLEARSDVEFSGLPALVELTPRAFEALDGWPSDNPAQIYEHLLAAISAEAEATTDPVRKRRLQKVADSLRELGVSTASKVLADVLLGGA